MFHIIRDSKLRELEDAARIDGIAYGVRVGQAQERAAQRELGCVLEGYDAVREAERIIKEEGK